MIRTFAVTTMLLMAILVSAPDASADACESEHLQKALKASLRQVNTSEEFQQAVTEIDE